jgi:formylglycine-generating enzyme required for sulfatase activity
VPARSWSFVALVLAAGSAAAASPRPLAWRFAEKDQFYAEWTFLQLVKTHMNQLRTEAMEDARVVTHFTVLKKKPDGGVLLEMQIELVQCRALGKAAPLLPMKLEGAVLRVTLNPDLSLARVDGLEETLLRLAGPSGPEMKPLRDNIENQLRFWLDNIFYPLPGRSVAKSHTWRQTKEIPVAGVGNEQRVKNFCYEGQEVVDGRTLQKIVLTANSRYVYDGPEDPGILNRRPRPEVTKQKQGGTIYYDPKTGRLAGATTRDFLQAEGEGRLRGDDVTVGIEMHVAQTLRLSDCDPLAKVARHRANRDIADEGEEQEDDANKAKGFVNSLGMKLVAIPAGSFTMGTPPGQADRTPWDVEHEVEITQPFCMGAHEVTIGQYRRFVEATGYKPSAQENGKGCFGYDPVSQKLEASPRYTWRRPGWEVNDNHPVVNLSWTDCKAFCDWLSKKEGRKYRMPTEAEWEYACRAGTKTRYHSGDDPETLTRVANVVDASAKKLFPQWQAIQGDDGHPFTAPVGSFKPNAWSLYDMHGNALEWCDDWFWHINPDDARDPQGPPFGALKVQRGGSWADFPYQSTSSRRTGLAPDLYCISSGFRVVTTAQQK